MHSRNPNRHLSWECGILDCHDRVTHLDIILSEGPGASEIFLSLRFASYCQFFLAVYVGLYMAKALQIRLASCRRGLGIHRPFEVTSCRGVGGRMLVWEYAARETAANLQ